jgi:AraC-like DNA-binding protein
LGRHPRQLQRALEATGKRYRELRDAVLSVEARWLLVETDLPIADIAGEVGFSDAATFTRAFSRWQGSGPGAYRAAFRSK